MGFRHIRKNHRHTPNRNPLRKIVDRVRVQISDSGATAVKELLECGHLQFPVNDFAGETNAVRRRCWQCGRAGE
jgi:hypothetical protein